MLLRLLRLEHWVMYYLMKTNFINMTLHQICGIRKIRLLHKLEVSLLLAEVLQELGTLKHLASKIQDMQFILPANFILIYALRE